jgi:hypothetical protein
VRETGNRSVQAAGRKVQVVDRRVQALDHKVQVVDRKVQARADNAHLESHGENRAVWLADSSAWQVAGHQGVLRYPVPDGPLDHLVGRAGMEEPDARRCPVYGEKSVHLLERQDMEEPDLERCPVPVG